MHIVRILLAAGVLFGTAQLVSAEEPSQAALAARLSQLESELASLRSQLATSQVSTVHTPAQGAVATGVPHGVIYGTPAVADFPQPRTAGWIGGFEWTMLQVYGADRGAAADDGATGDIFDGRNVSEYTSPDSGMRYWLGYENCGGSGFRARYWSMDSDADSRQFLISDGSVNAIIGGLDSNVEVEALDIEFTQRGQLRSWSLLGTGGIRYGRFAMKSRMGVADDDTLPFDESLEHDQRFKGWGPTVSLEGRRRLGGSNLYFFANGRGSLLFGNGEEVVDLNNSGTDAADFDDDFGHILPVLETQIGVEYARPMRGGAVFFCRAAMEGQLWMGTGDIGGGLLEQQLNAGLDNRFFGANDNLGLFGLALSAGISR